MIRSAESFTSLVWLGAAAIMAVVGSTSRQAEAHFCCSGPPLDAVTDYAVLYTDDPHRLFWRDSNTNSNIGIGDTGAFSGSGTGTIAGQVRFSAPLNLNIVQFSPDGIKVNGGAAFEIADVATNLASLVTLSRTLSTEPGTPLTITGGGSINASSGIFDGRNFVFSAHIGVTGGKYPESTFTPGTEFTINGASDQFVVINIPELHKINGETVGFNGSIVLDGGITPDHVYFNLHRGEDLIGGDPLIMNTMG